jgi:1,4-dihydroxy-2-naphthoate octaprenyltransferase
MARSAPELSNPKSWRAWLLATRPKTLTTALIPIVVGTSLSYATQNTVRPVLSLLALLSAIMIQVGTNFINDALDFEKGAETPDRVGPKRVTQSGMITAKRVWWGGLGCFFLSSLLALPLVYVGGWPIIAIGMFSLLAGYAYTGGPYPLAYVGLGDLFVLIFFGWVAVSGVYYLNTGLFDLNALIAGTQIGLLATVLIAINNFRDMKTDRKVHKNTLAVRLGAKFVRIEIALLCLVPFLAGFFWLSRGLGWACGLPWLMAPFAFLLVRKVEGTEPSQVYNRFLAQAAALHLGFGLLLSLGLYLR